MSLMETAYAIPALKHGVCVYTTCIVAGDTLNSSTVLVYPAVSKCLISDRDGNLQHWLHIASTKAGQ